MATITLQPNPSKIIRREDTITSSTATYSSSYIQFLDSGIIISGSVYRRRTFAEFDISSIPNNVEISDAKLCFYVYVTNITGGIPVNMKSLSAHNITSEWTIDNIATEPTFSGTAVDTKASDTAPIWVELNVTSSLRNMHKGITTNYGWVLKNTDDSYQTSYNSLRYIRESAYATTSERPKLVVIYDFVPPSPPTNLTPSGGTSLDRALIQRLSWRHNPYVPGEAQTKFDLQWRLQGAGTWNTVTQTTVNQYYDAPVSTFTRGTIEWQVRTYDALSNVSAYSSLSVFVAGDKPATPVITSPANGPTALASFIAMVWTSSGQTHYNIELKNAADTILLWEKTATGTEVSTSIGYGLADGAAYILKLRIKNSDGLWSNYAVSNFSADFVQPPTPTAVISTDATRGSLTLTITNLTETAEQPYVSLNYIYRRIKGDTAWDRISITIVRDGSYTDYTLRSAKAYEYKVRAIGNNGDYADSLVYESSVAVSMSQIALTSDYTKHISLRLKPSRSINYQAESVKTLFAGRKYAVTEFGEHSSVNIPLTFLINTSVTLDALIVMANSKTTLLYRDDYGRREFCTIDSLNVVDELAGYWTVSFALNAVDYVEVV